MMTRWVAGIACLVPCVEGHMHQQFPVSRQYGRSEDFHNSTYENLEPVPYAYNAGGVKAIQARARNATAPEVLAAHGGGGLFPLYFSELAANGNYLEPEEIAVRKGVCGDPRLGDPVEENTYSTSNSEWPVVDSYEGGQVIEINAVVVYYHWGHLEFFVCDVTDLDDPDGAVTQECLNKYPLSRSPDVGSGSPIDPSYPGRYYLDPPCRLEREVEQSVSSNFLDGSYNVLMRYEWPEIECEHCVLQMHYVTGDRCKHIGYDEFDPPSWNSECAPNKADWIDTDMGLCGEALSYPEEFWACSDIKITPRPATPAVTTPPPSSTLDRSAASAAPAASPSAAPTGALTVVLTSAAPTTDAAVDTEVTWAPVIAVNPSESGASQRAGLLFTTISIGFVLIVCFI